MAYQKRGYVLLSTWHQFRRLNDEYTFKLSAERDIRKVVVDPHNLLMDINRMNNQSGLLPPVEVRFDNMFYDRTPVNEYALRWRPDLWYDEPNGPQVGFHAHGSYLEVEHRFSLDVRLGTKSGRAFVDAEVSFPFRPFGARSVSSHKFLMANHRSFMSTTLEKTFRHWYSRPDHELFRLELNYLDMSGKQANRFEPLPDDRQKYLPDQTWEATDTYYAVVTSRILRTFRYGSYGLSDVLTYGAYSEDGRRRAFSQHRMTAELTLQCGNKPWFHLGLSLLDGFGEPPMQFLHHLGRVRSVDRFLTSPLFLTPGTFPVDWENDFYLADNRVRGYQDRDHYLIESLGASLELTPPDGLPFGWFRHLPLAGGFLAETDNALFVDYARVDLDGKGTYYPSLITDSDPNAGADKHTDYVSAGISLMLPSLWHEQTLRVDFPLYLNRPVVGDDEFAFRLSVAWLLPLP
jgi:hypothetical protein